MNRTSTGWMRNLRRRRLGLRHGLKAGATDAAAIVTGAGGVGAADAGQAAGTEAATTVVDAEADGRGSFWLLVARPESRPREIAAFLLRGSVWESVLFSVLPQRLHQSGNQVPIRISKARA